MPASKLELNLWFVKSRALALSPGSVEVIFSPSRPTFDSCHALIEDTELSQWQTQ